MLAEESEDKNGEIGAGLLEVARAIKSLGTGSNGDPRGAVEYLAVQTQAGAEAIAGAIRDHAKAMQEVAGAIEGLVAAINVPPGQ